MQPVKLDSLQLARLDLVKIDIECMGFDALAGAADMITSLKPIAYVELLKSDAALIRSFFVERGYRAFRDAMDCLYAHEGAPCIEPVQSKHT